MNDENDFGSGSLSDLSEDEQEKKIELEKKFGFLRILSGILTLLAIANGLLGCAIATVQSGGVNGPAKVIMILVVTGLFTALLLAVAQIIGVVLAIEENTRRAALEAGESD